MRTAPLAGAALCLALAGGCGSPVPVLDGEAAPIGAASPSAATASSAPTSAAPVAPSVIGPFGVGALRLGMNRKQAEATGLITKWVAGTPDQCTITAHLRDRDRRPEDADDPGGEGSIYYSEDGGVQAIDAHVGLHTPEGIKLGSSWAQVQKAYPDWDIAADPDFEKYGNGVDSVDVPGNFRAVYQIALNEFGVVHLALHARGQSCVE
ncbi:hypothetical protein ACIBSW_20305 [Actinoplanes sp. NPDC049668]|uniref:hypothetical protein n=1 Tax=unclassified Actinoplanes TaxID=2626549 RepID=UPI0033BB732F